MGTADVQSVCAIMQEEEMDNKKLQQQFEERMKKAGVCTCVHYFFFLRFHLIIKYSQSLHLYKHVIHVGAISSGFGRQFILHFVLLRITIDGSIPNMYLWSLLFIQSD